MSFYKILHLIIVFFVAISLCDANRKAHVKRLIENLLHAEHPPDGASYKTHLYKDSVDPLVDDMRIGTYGSLPIGPKFHAPDSRSVASKCDQVKYIRARPLLQGSFYTTEGSIFRHAFTPFGPKSFRRRPRSITTSRRKFLNGATQTSAAKRVKRQTDCTRSKYRTFDGACNNVNNRAWGSTQQSFIRLLPSEYGDKLGTLRLARSGRPLPNARNLSSTILSDQAETTEYLSTLIMQWGQFVDHDIVLTPTSSKEDGTRYDCCDEDRAVFECSSIDTSKDPFYSQYTDCLAFTRSRPSKAVAGREQMNLNTAYIDASLIYGDNITKANNLRTFSMGTMKTSPAAFNGFKPLLPLIFDEGCAEKNRRNVCVIVGDIRGNEQLALTVMHTIWLREHNRIAGKLREVNPSWNDETLYQEARKVVGALIQHITYNEYLPFLLGPYFMDLADLELGPPGTYFIAYNSSTEAGIINSFATAAFRFGHSLIPRTYQCLNSNYKSIQFNAGPLGRVSELRLRDAMLNPMILYQNATREDASILDCLLRNLFANAVQTVSPGLNQEVREHLLKLSGDPTGADLAAFNIMRGRDHGLPSYSKFRNEICRPLIPDLKLIRSFDDLKGVIPDGTLASVRRQYEHVEDIDLFPLGLAEWPLPNGGILGPTFACITALQFRNLKFLDAFWYENLNPQPLFKIRQLDEIRKMTLSKIICQNSDSINRIQEHAFVLTKWDINPEIDCAHLPDIDFRAWRA